MVNLVLKQPYCAFRLSKGKVSENPNVLRASEGDQTKDHIFPSHLLFPKRMLIKKTVFCYTAYLLPKNPSTTLLSE